MATVPIFSYKAARVDPIQDEDLTKYEDVPLAVGTYLQGTMLGQISGTNTNDVQTITISGTPTHSTMTLSGLPGGQSYTAAQDVSPAALATALNALLGASSVGVTGTANASYVITWGGAYASTFMPLLGVSANFAGGTSPAIAIAHTTPGIGPNGSFAAYASGNTDGTQTARGILAYACTVQAPTDGSGVNDIIYADHGRTYKVAPMYYRGTFNTGDLTGLDANAVTNMAASLVRGTTTAGKLVLA